MRLMWPSLFHDMAFYYFLLSSHNQTIAAASVLAQVLLERESSGPFLCLCPWSRLEFFGVRNVRNHRRIRKNLRSRLASVLVEAHETISQEWDVLSSLRTR